MVPVGLKPTLSLSGHVLKNRKMDEIRLFLHTKAHRASQRMAGGDLRFSLRKEICAIIWNAYETKTAQVSGNRMADFPVRSDLQTNRHRRCVIYHVATRYGGPTEMPPGLMGFPAGMISRAALIFGVALGLQPSCATRTLTPDSAATR